MRNTLLITALTIIANLGYAQTKLSIDSAGAHIGEKVIICSEVFGVKSTDKVTFINLGAAYPNSPLTIVIFTKDLSNFTDSPVTLYNNKRLCVTGTLKDYKGKTEIVITQPGEITLQ